MEKTANSIKLYIKIMLNTEWIMPHAKQADLTSYNTVTTALKADI